MNTQKDERYMRLALKEAEAAAADDEVPVGAVFVLGDRVLASVRNRCETRTDPTAHAERIGITQACRILGCQRLSGVEVYVTKEPCAMCAGALVHARIARLIIGTPDLKAGACGSVLQVVQHPGLNHTISTSFGVLEEDCRRLLQEFFQRKRREKAGE